MKKRAQVAKPRKVISAAPQRAKQAKQYRTDGFVNVLNRYGTSRDSTEAYQFQSEARTPDALLTSMYSDNGLFATIIDTPAEEALKHGFDLNINNDDIDKFVSKELDGLEWEEKAATAIKWTRLYGGAIAVMLINDGKPLEAPVDWKHIKSIDEIQVFERAVVTPDYENIYRQQIFGEGLTRRGSNFGQPQFYTVDSSLCSFTVHESRCLIFKNGVLPDRTMNLDYRFWGIPEYQRIKRALRETITAHGNATKMLERSVQAIYSMKNLAQALATDEGEQNVTKRLELIDLARGIMNSIAIDAEGESYDFKTFQFTGVKDVIDATCNMLSALTKIPQTILFGRSPAGMNATGESDFENYYNFVESIQKQMLKKNLRYLLDIIFQAGLAQRKIDEIPEYELEFKPLWSLSDSEQATVDQTKAATALTKAQTAQVYVDMQAMDPSEVRAKLASEDEFIVEDIIDGDSENDLYNSLYPADGSAFGEGQPAPTEGGEKNNLQNSQNNAIINGDSKRCDADDKDVQWITVNGAHIPVKDGVAVGGAEGELKGEDFSAAQSEESKPQAQNSIDVSYFAGGDIGQITSDLKNIEAGTTLVMKTGGKEERYTKTDDGKWKKEDNGYICDTAAVAFNAMLSSEVSAEGGSASVTPSTPQPKSDPKTSAPKEKGNEPLSSSSKPLTPGENRKFSDIEQLSEATDVLSQAPIGTVVKTGSGFFTKTGDDEWENNEWANNANKKVPVSSDSVAGGLWSGDVEINPAYVPKTSVAGTEIKPSDSNRARDILALQSAPVGTKLTTMTDYEETTFTKIGEDSWESSKGSSDGWDTKSVIMSASRVSEDTRSHGKVGYETPDGKPLDYSLPKGQLSDLQAEALLANTAEQWESGISKTQKSALKAYSHKGDKAINSALREGNDSGSDRVKKQISAIDSAISSFDLPQDIKVYRGTSTSSLGLSGEIDGSVIGKVISDPAYTSTSVERKRMDYFAREAVDNDRKKKIKDSKEVRLELDIPAGQGRGAYISQPSTCFSVEEREFLVKRGSAFEIYDYAVDNNGYVLKGRLKDG